MTESAADAAFPYCVRIAKGAHLPAVYLGFTYKHQAEQVASHLKFWRLNSNCPEDAEISDGGLTPPGVIPLPPVPTTVGGLIEAMNAEDESQSHADRYPDLYTRLQAQEGHEEAARLWKAACSLMDAEAEHAEFEQQEAQREQQRRRAAMVEEATRLRNAYDDTALNDRDQLRHHVLKVLCDCIARGFESGATVIDGNCNHPAEADKLVDAVLDGLISLEEQS